MIAASDAQLSRAKRVMQALKQHELTIATAESCTGGVLASILTDLRGLSHVFECSFVVYSDQAKCDLLGIDRVLVTNFGAVSREVAEAMAGGALRRSRASIAIAITGFAGPGGEGDEEGLVHFACARGQSLRHREKHFGPIGRDRVRRHAIDSALDLIEEAIAG
ncbi:CinA family protein [Croceicoccus naphthovorans]|uniref:Damage-inducible protein CinA n=1 Tax=Croceicoccus naphthovorans TaxID=1348774 RepID=A0A0G3XM36_9SPHN|nr:nicotinamide-nucleotide amidohydrolase family protein [Croceicoccus naphthovorans]AKM11691.1 damage-inducible protein CinA [Croceicoccus naphthovorans]MBB3991183.1 nicotinamide-nucleotide amidase [Croceicoccus naphthovorans]